MSTEQRVEQQILAAIGNGFFDALKGCGAALNREEYPFEPAEWRLPFRVMRMAGSLPEWIALGREIAGDLEALQSCIQEFSNRTRMDLERIVSDPERDLAQRLGHAYEGFKRRRTLLQRRLREVRRKMDRFNLIAPRAAARPELQVKPVMEQFDRCWPWAGPS